MSNNDSCHDEVALTAAELLRRKQKKVHGDGNKIKEYRLDVQSSNDVDVVDETDLDETIKRLEASLQHENDNSNEDNDDVSSSRSNTEMDVNCKNDHTMVLSSALNEDRIEGLPSEYLPKTKRRMLKGIDIESTRSTGERKRKKRKGKDGDGHVNSNDEIKKAVQEILGNYKARSSERLPFYCRCCAIQFDSEINFNQHKQTPFHMTAVEMERKASYCKLCRKQLTSPTQLSEHLQSKPHKQRLHSLKQSSTKKAT